MRWRGEEKRVKVGGGWRRFGEVVLIGRYLP